MKNKVFFISSMISLFACITSQANDVNATVWGNDFCLKGKLISIDKNITFLSHESSPTPIRIKNGEIRNICTMPESVPPVTEKFEYELTLQGGELPIPCKFDGMRGQKVKFSCVFGKNFAIDQSKINTITKKGHLVFSNIPEQSSPETKPKSKLEFYPISIYLFPPGGSLNGVLLKFTTREIVFRHPVLGKLTISPRYVREIKFYKPNHPVRSEP